MKRALLVVLALLALAIAVVAAPPQQTEATWTDGETSSGSFTALTVPKPVITACTATNVLGATSVTMKWNYSSTTPTPTANLWFSRTSLLTIQLVPNQTTTTGPVAGTYTTTFDSALLNNLLGGTAYLGVDATQNTWTSAPATASIVVPTIIGSNSNCLIN